MKRKLVVLPLVIVCFLCSFTTENSDNENNSLHNYGFEAYLDELFSTIEELGRGDGVDIFEDGVGGALDKLLESLSSSVISVDSLILFAAAILISLSGVLCEGMENEQTVSAAVGAILSLPAVRSLSGAFSVAADGISSGSVVFSELIPTLCATLSISSGAYASSVASSGLGITLSIVSKFVSGGMLLAAELIFAFAMIGSIDGIGSGSGIAKGIKNAFMLVSGGVSVFTLGSLSVSSALSSAADSLGLRAARYAASSVLPIVGGAVSGALGVLVSGVRALSSAIGLIGSAAILSAFAMPLVTLFGYKISLGSCSILCTFSGSSHGQRLFSSLSAAADAMIAALALSATLYILEITVLMSVVKGAL